MQKIRKIARAVSEKTALPTNQPNKKVSESVSTILSWKTTKETFTCSKSTVKTLEKEVKYVQT